MNISYSTSDAEIWTGTTWILTWKNAQSQRGKPSGTVYGIVLSDNPRSAAGREVAAIGRRSSWALEDSEWQVADSSSVVAAWGVAYQNNVTHCVKCLSTVFMKRCTITAGYCYCLHLRHTSHPSSGDGGKTYLRHSGNHLPEHTVS